MPRRSQLERSRSTKAALVATARRLFAQQGYAATAAEEIVAAAGVTRGALYHHFGDKRGLFIAVVEELEDEITAEMLAMVGDAIDPATDLMAGVEVSLRRYLDICQRPEILRIILADAPSVLGWQEWREMEARHGLGLVTGIVAQAAAKGKIDEGRVPTISQLLFSAIIEAGLMVAHADQPDTVRPEVERSLLLLIEGLL